MQFLSPQSRIIDRIVRCNLEAKKGDCDSLTGVIKIIVYCILAEIPISLPALLFQTMLDVTKIDRGLPYGPIITRLLESNGIHLSTFSQLLPKPPKINFLTFQDKKSQKRPAVDEVEEELDAADPVPLVPQEEESSSTPAGVTLEGLQMSISALQKTSKELPQTVSQRNSLLRSLSRFMKKIGDALSVRPPKGFSRHFSFLDSSTADDVALRSAPPSCSTTPIRAVTQLAVGASNVVPPSVVVEREAAVIPPMGVEGDAATPLVGVEDEVALPLEGEDVATPVLDVDDDIDDLEW